MHRRELGLFIYGVAVDRVVEIALGYNMSPLFSVLLGVLVLRERPRRAQWVALTIATAAVLMISIAAGAVPWIAIGLGLSFGVYGLLKKTVPLTSTASLTAEGVVLSPVAAALIVLMQLAGTGTLVGHGWGHVLLLIAAGPVTAAPLLLYGSAARWVGFGLVWVALAIFTVDLVRAVRRPAPPGGDQLVRSTT